MARQIKMIFNQLVVSFSFQLQFSLIFHNLFANPTDLATNKTKRIFTKYIHSPINRFVDARIVLLIFWLDGHIANKIGGPKKPEHTRNGTLIKFKFPTKLLVFALPN